MKFTTYDKAGNLVSESSAMPRYDIIEIGKGWYDFKNIPQGYIKVHGRVCASEEGAKLYAQELLQRNGLESQFVELKIVKAL